MALTITQTNLSNEYKKPSHSFPEMSVSSVKRLCEFAVLFFSLSLSVDQRRHLVFR